MPIDLKKLKALELPTKEIEVDILGETQKVKITCPGDDTAVNVSSLYQQKGDYPELTVDVVKMFLGSCLPELETADIELIIKRDFKAASKIAKAGRELLEEFVKTKNKNKEQIKKKSTTVAETPVKKS